MVLKLRRVLNDIIDIIYPREAHCIACNRESETYNRYGFCHTCFESLPFIEPPYCNICGRHLSEDGKCSECTDVDHVFTQAVAVFEYEPPISDIIHRFKYRNYKSLAEPMAMLMTEIINEKGWNIDCIVPVPLHANRLNLRGYNQATYLAHSIGKLMEGKEILDTALIRRRNTPSQIGMDRDRRMWNLYDAFEVREKSLVEGKTILLVDDVLTTGSTADNCCSALLDAGAKGVYVSTFAVSVFHQI